MNDDEHKCFFPEWAILTWFIIECDHLGAFTLRLSVIRSCRISALKIHTWSTII